MERVEVAAAPGGRNGMPSMFNAGISNKFTKRHVDNFRDTTLTAASAAKARAEKKLERQADAIDKQQKKIESEMRKVEELAQRLHRQQVREAKRLRGRLTFAAKVIQHAFRKHKEREDAKKQAAAVAIQCLWRGALARELYVDLQLELIAEVEAAAASVIARSTHRFICRRARQREYGAQQHAALVIQGGFRVAVARRHTQLLRMKRAERMRRERAAVMIQATARSFVTRLIYLDVLFLICRIQAVARGFLVRRWRRHQRQLEAVESAVVTLQAHARGFCVRNRRREQVPSSIAVLSPSSSTASVVAPPSLMQRKTPKQRETSTSGVPPAKKTPSLRVPVAESPAIKRSYWLPAGASFNKRLPIVLPPTLPSAPSSAAAGAALGAAGCAGDDVADLVRCFPKQAPRRRPHTRPRPGRLSPVAASGGGSRSPSSRPTTSNSSHEDQHCLDGVSNDMDAMQRLRREAEVREVEELDRLQRKEKQLQERQARREKRRLELEAQTKRQVEEREESERGMMEREDRAMRLYVKLLQRRSREGRVRRQSAEQQREERERIAMAREERHTRLCLKRRRVPPRPIDDPIAKPVAASSIASQDTRRYVSSATSSLSATKLQESRVVNSTLKKTAKIAHRHKIRDSRGLSSPPASRDQRERREDATGNQQDVAATWQARIKARLMMPAGDEEDGIDYGNEFEDMVDEVHLAVY